MTDVLSHNLKTCVGSNKSWAHDLKHSMHTNLGEYAINGAQGTNA
jgi:hypothetical protein